MCRHCNVNATRVSYFRNYKQPYSQSICCIWKNQNWQNSKFIFSCISVFYVVVVIADFSLLNIYPAYRVVALWCHIRWPSTSDSIIIGEHARYAKWPPFICDQTQTSQRENNNNNGHVYLWRRLATGSRWREHIITVLLGDIKTERRIPGTLHSPADFCFRNAKLTSIVCLMLLFVLSGHSWWTQCIVG